MTSLELIKIILPIYVTGVVVMYLYITITKAYRKTRGCNNNFLIDLYLDPPMILVWPVSLITFLIIDAIPFLIEKVVSKFVKTKYVQKLILFESEFDNLSKGKKMIVREGRMNIELGQTLLESKKTKRQELVNITNVQYCKFKDISTEYLKENRYIDLDYLQSYMKEIYEYIPYDYEVTVIKFKQQ